MKIFHYFNPCLILILATGLLLSCRKDLNSGNTDDVNNNPSSSPTGIGNFNVRTLTRTATADTISWTRPSVPAGSNLRFKVYLNLLLSAEDISDTSYVFSNLVADTSYTGRVVAYISASDSISVNFSLPAYGTTSPPDPYGYLRGYYKVSEHKEDFWTGGDVSDLIFTGRIEISQDTIANFLQLPRTPSAWWEYNFFNVKIWPYENDSLFHYSNSSFNGRILDQNTVRVHYLFGAGSTVHKVEQIWEKLQDPADSVAYTFQWSPDAPGIIKSLAGTNCGSSGPIIAGDGGPAVNAVLSVPYCVYSDAQQNVYIGDGNWFKSAVRKVNAAGIIDLFAGSYSDGFSGDGGPATAAQLHTVTSIVSDGNGNVYISDQENRVIRKVNSSGIITTFAGIPGQWGYSGDGGPATAAMITGGRLTADASGNIYLSDAANNVIRKIDLNGIITTIAGTGVSGHSGDGGPALSAQFAAPNGMVFDQQGNLYIAEYNSHTIRKISTNGIVTTIAGTAYSYGFTGDGGPATLCELNNPVSLAIDVSGNLYIADQSNNRIRKINSNGVITTIGGTGSSNYLLGANWQTFNGDFGLAIQAVIRRPTGIFCSGNILYVVDANSRIRKIFL